MLTSLRYQASSKANPKSGCEYNWAKSSKNKHLLFFSVIFLFVSIKVLYTSKIVSM